MTTPNLEPEEEKLPLKVLIDTKSNKVVFAEADSNFVDILFGFMTLPLGGLAKLLDKHFDPRPEAMGSFCTLNHSLKNLSSSSFWTREGKLILLNPRSSSEFEFQNLKLNLYNSPPYFICEDWDCIRGSYVSVSISYNITRCKCGKLMNRKIWFDKIDAQKGIFTTPGMCFLISDDLQVKTNLVGSSLKMLNSLGIKDTSSLKTINFLIGSKEMVSLLLCSLVSDTPLSDVLLHDKKLNPETFRLSLSQTSKSLLANSNFQKMVVKVIVDKSTNNTNKVYFAEAEEDFIEFLFSLLTIPLGNLVSLLRGNTSLGGIVKLYDSISCLDSPRYIKSEEARASLLHPNIPPQYLGQNKIFALFEKQSADLLLLSSFDSQTSDFKAYLSHRPLDFIQPLNDENNFTDPVTLKELKGGSKGFVRGPASFMVGDDLKVSTLSPISCLSFLEKLGVSLCDVEERVVNVGIDEALGILRAALTSSSALTNGLNLCPTLKQIVASDFAILDEEDY